MPLFYLKISIYDQTNKFYDYLLKNLKQTNNTNFFLFIVFFLFNYFISWTLIHSYLKITFVFFISLFLFFYNQCFDCHDICIYINQGIEETIVMTHFAPIKLAICLIYAVMSIFQTLNSRFLYRNLGFDYYSFVWHIIYRIGFWSTKDHYYLIFLSIHR